MDNESAPLNKITLAASIPELTLSGESETVEFKQSTGEMREILETVSAFANTQGGVILVGVANAGNILGITLGKDTLEALANSIQQHMDPKVFPSLAASRVEGKTVIVVRVEQSPVKPVLVQGRGFKRIGRSNHLLSSAEVAYMSMASRSLSWDAGPAEGSTLSDLDPEAVRRFLVAAERERNIPLSPDTPLDEVLEKLELWRDGQPTRAAILLFAKEPQRFLRQSEVRVARFKGTQPLHFLDMKVVEGRLIEQRELIVEFIQRHISMAAEINGLERQERWEYPLAALREAVTNALCHRDYRDPGNVQVRIFDDRLEVWSPGLLPPEVSIESLRHTHRSVPRNRLIAYVFFLIKFVEQWGTGTLRMIEACQEAGLPDPEFVETSGAFVVILRKSKLTQEFLQGLGLNERQAKAVDHAKTKGSVTNADYVRLTGISRNWATKELKELVEKGVFERVGKGKGSHYKLRGA